VWTHFLSDFEIKRFHAAEFWARKGRPYARWDDEKHESAIKRVSSILRNSGLFGIGTGVTIDAFNEWRDSLSYYIDPDPYFFCLNRSLKFLIRGIRINPDEGVAVYIDQDKGRERLGQELARWHEAKLRSRGHLIDLNRDRSVSTHYASSFNYPPLQVADILSNSFFKQSFEFLRTGKAIVPPFIQALLDGQNPVGTILFYDREMLDIEERSRLGNE